MTSTSKPVTICPPLLLVGLTAGVVGGGTSLPCSCWYSRPPPCCSLLGTSGVCRPPCCFSAGNTVGAQSSTCNFMRRTLSILIRGPKRHALRCKLVPRSESLQVAFAGHRHACLPDSVQLPYHHDPVFLLILQLVKLCLSLRHERLPVTHQLQRAPTARD